MQELKGRLKEIYDFIAATVESRGIPPSVREICAGVGLSSPSSVHSYLAKLEELGHIKKDSKKMRTISLTAAPVPSQIPILGRVTAGGPVFAFEDVSGYVPYKGRPGFEYFALRVSGDSMVGAGIYDGDLVVVQKQDRADNGAIVVALLEDEATVKRLRLDRDRIWLMPENSAYAPIDGSRCHILGRVCALMRDM